MVKNIRSVQAEGSAMNQTVYEILNLRNFVRDSIDFDSMNPCNLRFLHGN